MEELDFRLDRTGFPLVGVPELNAYLQWLPVTKIQFEYFMCAEPDSKFDETWYETICALNPRVSPKGIRLTNYWNAFLTGITPGEVERFMHWCGPGYAIPTLSEWNTAYRFLMQREPILEIGTVLPHMGNLRERTRTLLTELDKTGAAAIGSVGYQRTLADQMLMRMGVMEWVECQDQRVRWGGMGETSSRFHGSLFTPDHGQPTRPRNPDYERLNHYGFRLLWRAE